MKVFGVSPAGNLQKGAELSACRRYRYMLWRRWDWDELCNWVAFVGLNPSTADEMSDDPTIRRCVNFAKAWGFGGMLMLNAFAFRATDPKSMMAADDPIGPENDSYLCVHARASKLVVACWGSHCPAQRQADACTAIGTTIDCLGTTKHGRPKHPLYLPKTARLKVFWSPSVVSEATQ